MHCTVKRGDTCATFHLFGKKPFVMDMLNNFVKGSTNTGEIQFQHFNTDQAPYIAFDRDNLSICIFVSSTAILGINTKTG